MESNSRRTTNEQKLALVQYLEEHREFAHDRFVNGSGCKGLADWASVSQYLNSLAGAYKDAEGWKKAWANMRSKAKQKAQDLKAEMDRTGGGIVSSSKKLKELDERIIGVMRKEGVVWYPLTDPLRASGTFPDTEIFSKELEEASQIEVITLNNT